MASRKAKQRYYRRERRKAKESNYARPPKNPKRHGHGTSLTFGHVSTKSGPSGSSPGDERFPGQLRTTLADLLDEDLAEMLEDSLKEM